MNEINGFELKMGTRYYHFYGSENPFNNNSSSGIAANKYCTNKLLEKAGIPVPMAVAINRTQFQHNKTVSLITHLRFPLVVKPLLDGSKGKDVLCNIQTMEQLNRVLTDYFSIYHQLLIEEFHGNLKSFRVLVFKRQVIGVILRHPAKVIGDGTHTIKELVEQTNEARKKINDFLGPIMIDDECKIRLNELGITEQYIPSFGEKVVLCYTSNATRGGTYESLQTKICKKNRKLMIRAASLLNLELTGIDVECADLNKPLMPNNGVIIEVNHRPSVRIHELPLTGSPHLVTRKIMRFFIFRHPLAYLHSLYSNKPTAFYIRSLLFLGLFGVMYLFFI